MQKEIAFVVCFLCFGCFAFEVRKGKFIVGGDMISRVHPWIKVAAKGTQWPKGIVPYEFQNVKDYEEEDVKDIKSAMKYIEENSCVHFVPRTANDNDYVIIKADDGCNSEVGKQGGPQELVLDTPFCMSKGVLIHELMHTLGFIHEQSREDRDDNVDIRFENIDAKYKDNFEKTTKVESDHFNEPYDHKSVMHYFYNEFAIDSGKPTIESKSSKVQSSELAASKRLGILSEIDKIKLNKFYGCT